MMFSPESVTQLEAAGEGLFTMIENLTNGLGWDDATAVFSEAMLAKEVVDEFKADKAKAAAVLLGAAMKKFGIS